MDEFWEWMEEKKYGNYLMERLNDNYCFNIRPTKQMLIGYMIEYIIFKQTYIVGHNIFDEYQHFTDIDKFYNRLKNRIKGVE
jgi:hypothetical protein